MSKKLPTEWIYFQFGRQTFGDRDDTTYAVRWVGEESYETEVLAWHPEEPQWNTRRYPPDFSDYSSKDRQLSPLELLTITGTEGVDE